LPQRVLGCPASIPRLQLCRRAARSTKTLERDRNLRYQHTADIRIHLQRLKRDTDSSDGERLQNVCCCIMGAQANKGKTVQTAASREKRIHWLMGEDGARRLGHQVPRWEAEQLVAPVGASLGMLDREEQRRKQDLERQQGLSKELHGHGYVGRAFEELCKAGCDARWLESVLLDLIEFPLGQSHATYTAKEKKRLERAIANLESAAHELGEFIQQTGSLILQSTVEDWPTPPHGLPIFLRGIAYCLRESRASGSTKWRGFRRMNAAFRIPYLIDEVERRTGRAHFREMAELIRAAYGRGDFSEQDLKMLVYRSRYSSRRRQSNSSSLKKHTQV
jgi:hypothetical protein